jgi:starch phosphorylase
MMTVHFNMRRVISDHSGGLYAPAAAQHAAMSVNDFAAARALAQWKQRVHQCWGGVTLRLMSQMPCELQSGEPLQLRVAASLNGLTPDDVHVEFIARRTLPYVRIESPALASFRAESHNDLWRVPLKASKDIDSDGSQVFELRTQPPTSGQYAQEIRIRPAHPLLAHPLELGLLKRL